MNLLDLNAAFNPTDKIYMLDLDLDSVSFIPTEKWFKRLIDRSQGQLVDITLHDVILNHALLLYVADRSSQLRRLALSHGVYNIGSLTKALMKFPILEELSLYSVEVSKEVIESAGRYCPMLKTLKVNYKICGRMFRLTDERSLMRYNEVAIAIGENLRELRHLEFISYDMTNIGLEAILDGCRHLETLDLSWCDYIDLSGDLGKRCSKQFKVLKLTQETLDYDVDSEDEDDHYRDSPDS